MIAMYCPFHEPRDTHPSVVFIDSDPEMSWPALLQCMSCNLMFMPRLFADNKRDSINPPGSFVAGAGDKLVALRGKVTMETYQNVYEKAARLSSTVDTLRLKRIHDDPVQARNSVQRASNFLVQKAIREELERRGAL